MKFGEKAVNNLTCKLAEFQTNQLIDTGIVMWNAGGHRVHLNAGRIRSSSACSFIFIAAISPPFIIHMRVIISKSNFTASRAPAPYYLSYLNDFVWFVFVFVVVIVAVVLWKPKRRHSP